MFLFTTYNKFSLSKKIYISTVLGFVFGMFFGDRCGVLEPLNMIFIKLFQTAIIPFMIFSIIHAIGSLTVDRAKNVGRKGGLVLLFLWSVSIFYAFGLQFSFPDIERSKFFRPETSSHGGGAELLDLFIPSNPFSSLANGYIPAIVIFCILLGLALMSHQHKRGVIKSAKIWASIMNTINDIIMKTLPLGVLVMATFTFGTMNFMKFKSVLLYVFASLFYLLFISFFVYPTLLTSISKVNFKKFFNYCMPAALIAFTTGSVFLALPVIYDQMYKFSDEMKGFEGMSDNYIDRGRNAVSMIVPLAWMVPASYKFLVIFFIVFGEWFYDMSSTLTGNFSYFIAGIPCLFGSNSVIVPFLLDLTGVPSKSYDVFMIVSSLLVYFNNANGAMFIITATIMCYLMLCNKVKVNFLRLFSLLALATLIYVIVIAGLNSLMTRMLKGDDTVKAELTHMNSFPEQKYFYERGSVEYLELSDYKKIDLLHPDESVLEEISRTGILQVAYDPEAIPFSFMNENGMLVGYDIDFVYDIAQNMGCNKIEFYKVHDIVEYQKGLANGIDIDICVGGFIYLGNVQSDIITSDPYMKCTPAIVIPKELKYKYPDFMSIFEDKDFKLGYRLSRDPKSVNNYLRRPFVPLQSYNEFYKERKTEGLLIPGEMAAALGIVHKGFWIYYYNGNYIKAFFAFVMSSGERASTFRSMVNGWINTCIWDGTAKRRYNYWIMGKTHSQVGKSWSVLSWLKENGFFIGLPKVETTQKSIE